MRGFVKDPASVLDYGFDWSPWLSGAEVITSSTWYIDSGLTGGSESFNDTSTLVFLSGGGVGQDYTVTNRIVTDGNRTVERSFQVQIRDR